MDAPYARAVAWIGAPARARVPLSRQQRSDFRRIAALPARWGRMLDELGAPYYLTRWVAGPGDQHQALREQRWQAAIAALKAPAGFGAKDFAALRQAHSPLRHHPPRHRLRRILERGPDVR